MNVPLTLFCPLRAAPIATLRAVLSAEPPLWLSHPMATNRGAWDGRVWLDAVGRGIGCRVGPLRAVANTAWRDLSWWSVDTELNRDPRLRFDGEIGLMTDRSVTVLNGTCSADDRLTGSTAVRQAATRHGSALLAQIASQAGMLSLPTT